MAHSAPGGTDDLDNKIIEEYRANEGRVSGPLAGTPMILLHHVGAKSGIQRVTPMAYTPQKDGHYMIVASNGGALRRQDHGLVGGSSSRWCSSATTPTTHRGFSHRTGST